MKKKTKKLDKKALRQEYYAAQRDGKNMLAWCTQKATENGLTYGQFVSKVGI